VLSQTPSAGTSAKNDSVIIMTVSAGAEVPSSPHLIGLTIEEAAAALEKTGLTLGSISYQVSDVAIGYVCSQSPMEGTELAPGSKVDICVSATTAGIVQMPVVTSMNMNDALRMLDDQGFNNILLRYDSSSRSDEGTILSQQPAPDESVQPNMRVTLTVSGKAKNGYFSDVAYNLNVPDSGTSVMVTMRDTISGIEHERILYEGILEKGNNVPISFRASASSGCIHELILYINGTEARRQEAGFEKVA